MKAHQVKCQICAPGILLVTYREPDNTVDTGVMVVSANLTEPEAIDLVARELAILKTKEAEQLNEQLTKDKILHTTEPVVYTSDDIKAGYVWLVIKTGILSHL